MALTDHCDLFGSLEEKGINLVARHLMLQRPSLFNYASRAFIINPKLLCHEIEAHPEVARRGNPLVTEEDPLPIPGTEGAYGIDFCLQITKAAIDFHPPNGVNLPPELAPLGKQRVALFAEVCAGIICPDADIADRLGDGLASQPPRDPQKDEDKEKTPKLPPAPVPGKEPQCFCLKVFAVAHAERVDVAGQEHLVARLEGLEIVDIRPEGLENAIECYAATILRIALLPKLRVALDTFLFDFGGFLTLTVGLTPISGTVPNNPAVEDDKLKVFADLGVAP